MFTTPQLDIRNLSRRVGNQDALVNVSFTIQPGEVVGLADRVGTSKSALVQLLAGRLSPDAGVIQFDGDYVSWPVSTDRLPIEVVYQDPALADLMDVTSNIFLGHEICWSFLQQWLQIPNKSKMHHEARRLLASLDVELPSLHEKVGNLTDEQRQLVAIAQVLARPAKLVVVENADSLLSLPYQNKLLDVIREWQRNGTAVLFSSKNIDHLFAVSDRLIVMRDGRLVTNVRTDETTREAIVGATVGMADRRERTPVIWALDSYYRARNQAETLRHNELLLKRDLAAQDSLNQQLVDQLAKQVKALDSANRALQDAQRRLMTEREQERKRLARELHDQMIQDLLSLNYRLEEIEDKAVDNTKLVDDVIEVRQDIRTLIEELRRICGNLRPPTIDSLGLGAALRSYLGDWSQRTGIRANLSLDNNFGRLPETIELSIFRIVQEGLSNVWKHSNAEKVQVTLEHTSPRMLLVTIEDDGQGIEQGVNLSTLSQSGHYGLLGISERVALMGGRLQFQNKEAGGMMIHVQIPHARVEPEEDLSEFGLF